MAWTAITTDNIKDRLTGPEMTALQNAALAESQVDPTSEIVIQVIDEVRGYVAAGGFTQGPEGTIPSKLKGATLNMIRYRLCSRLPVASLITEARKKEYDDALRLMEQVAAKKFLVEEPIVPSPEQAGNPTPRFNPRPLVFTPDNQDGT